MRRKRKERGKRRGTSELVKGGVGRKMRRGKGRGRRKRGKMASV